MTGIRPKSLSSFTSEAGRFSIPGKSTSTSFAIKVAATSANAADSAKTVTASAMPKLRERPRQPEVAIPRTGLS